MKNKITFIASLLFSLLFINSGLNKFFFYMPPPEDLPESLLKVSEAFNAIGWLMPLVGIVEIIGGVLCIFARTRALGAIVILPVMVGVLLTHILNMPSGLPIAIVLLLINVWMIVDNKEKYLPLIEA